MVQSITDTVEIFDATNVFRLSTSNPKTTYEYLGDKAIGSTQRFTDSITVAVKPDAVNYFDGVDATVANVQYKDASQYNISYPKTLPFSDGTWLVPMKYIETVEYKKVPEWWSPGRNMRAEVHAEVNSSSELSTKSSSFDIDLNKLFQTVATAVAVRNFRSPYTHKYVAMFVGLAAGFLPTAKMSFKYTIRALHTNDPVDTYDQISFSLFVLFTKADGVVRVHRLDDLTEVEVAVEAKEGVRVIKTRSKFVRILTQCFRPQPLGM